MAMTNEQLESAYVALAERLSVVDRKVSGTVSYAKFTANYVVFEAMLQELQAEIETLKARVDTLEAKL